MPSKVGEAAPPFRAVSDDGRVVDSAALRGCWVVLFFYPRASSPGCVLEARAFQAALPQFERSGAVVIGVSTDTEAAQAKFRDSCGLTYPLLPDGNKAVCRAYGVLGGLAGLLGAASRQTFLIDPRGNVARRWGRVNPGRHAAEVLEVLRGEAS